MFLMENNSLKHAGKHSTIPNKNKFEKTITIAKGNSSLGIVSNLPATYNFFSCSLPHIFLISPPSGLCDSSTYFVPIEKHKFCANSVSHYPVVHSTIFYMSTQR